MEDAFESLVSSVVVAAGSRGEDASGAFRSLRAVLEAHAGTVPVFLDLEPRPGFEAVYRIEGVQVRPSTDLVASLERIFGAGCLRLGRAPVAAPPRRSWGG